jgi:hypothetical protein
MSGTGREDVDKAAIDALYAARDSGLNMHEAAVATATAVLRAAAVDQDEAALLERARSAPDNRLASYDTVDVKIRHADGHKSTATVTADTRVSVMRPESYPLLDAIQLVLRGRRPVWLDISELTELLVETDSDEWRGRSYEEQARHIAERLDRG